MEIDRGVLEAPVPEEQLDGAQIGARFQQVCCETVPHRVRPDVFGESGAKRSARVKHFETPGMGIY